MKIFPQKRSCLLRCRLGPLKRDTGTIRRGDGRPRTQRDARRTGSYDLRRCLVWTLAGKRGTLTIRDRNEWVDVSNENTRYGYPPGVGIGTWKVVRGTGQYAAVVGKGRNGHAGLGSAWYARYEGFLHSAVVALNGTGRRAFARRAARSRRLAWCEIGGTSETIGHQRHVTTSSRRSPAMSSEPWFGLVITATKKGAPGWASWWSPSSCRSTA